MSFHHIDLNILTSKLSKKAKKSLFLKRNDKQGLVSHCFRNRCRFYKTGHLSTSVFSLNSMQFSLVVLPCMLSGTFEI